MEPEQAEALAREVYRGVTDYLNAPAIEHVERVAGAVEAPDDRVVAWLHDTLEDGLLTLGDLRGLTQVQTDALAVVTHQPGATYLEYIRGIRDFPGAAGWVARRVKLADLEENMTRPCPPFMLPMRETGGRYDRAWRILNDVDE